MSSAARGNQASRALRRLLKRRTPFPTELRDLKVFEGHRQGLPRVLPLLPRPPHLTPPLPHLRSIVRQSLKNQQANTPSSGSSSPHKFLSTGSPIYRSINMRYAYAEIEDYTLPCRSSLAERRTHLHITDDCTRLVGVCPIHRDESPTVRCRGYVCEIMSKE